MKKHYFTHYQTGQRVIINDDKPYPKFIKSELVEIDSFNITIEGIIDCLNNNDVNQVGRFTYFFTGRKQPKITSKKIINQVESKRLSTIVDLESQIKILKSKGKNTNWLENRLRNLKVKKY